MKLLREITDITAHYFLIDDNDLIVSTFSNQIKRIGVNGWEHSFIGIKYPKLVYGDNLFVQQRQEGSLKEGTGCIDLKTGDQKEISLLQSSVLLTSILQESKVLARHKDSDRKKSILLIDLSLLKSDWKIDTDLQFVWGFDKGILGQLSWKSEIVFIDFTDGRIMWYFDLSKLDTYQDYDGSEKQTQVNKILGIYEDKIYILLNSGKILILDIKSGDKITILKNDKHPKFDNFGDSIELDPNNGKLIQLANQDLIEVDLHNNYTVTLTPIEDMKSLNLENYSKFVFDDDFIYFSDYHHYKLGSLNRKTLKIDWIYDFPQDHDQSDNPRFGRELKLFNERLYVIDNKHTLHIFQKGSHPA